MDENSCDISLRNLDLSAFQDLADSFSRLTGISTAILDLQGEILAATAWKKICTDFHRRNPTTALRCQESDTIRACRFEHGERHNIYKCKNGLLDVAAPITIENVHVGNLFIGQFFLELPDTEFFIRQAEEFGFDKDMYIEALCEVPVLSMKEMDHAIEFLVCLTTIIGSAGLYNKRLFELSSRLEKRVRERTAELNYSIERLRVFSEASFEGIVLTENGVIIEANEKVSEKLGFQYPEELIGMKITSFIAPGKRRDAENKMLSNYEKPYETVGLTKNGTLFPIEVHGKTFSYQGRQVRGAAIRDLTQQKETEKEIQTLRGILPLCSFCKKIRDDKGYWEQVDIYIHKHTEADISHSICPECLKKYYPKEYENLNKKKD